MKSIYKSRKERRVFAMVMLALLTIIIAIGVLGACGMFDMQDWRPTISYPMTDVYINANGI